MAYDAVIIGSGPNGLAAGIRLAKQELSVKILEKGDTVGGGTRTQELTLPGFHHDVCSAIHPMAKASPYLNSLPLDDFGLEWIQPEIPLAHPLDDGPPGLLFRSLDETAEHLGPDGLIYLELIESFVDKWSEMLPDLLGPLPLFPRHLLLMARFGLLGIRSADSFTRRFKSEKARALFAGLAAHGTLPFNYKATAAIGLVLGITAHTEGWPYPKGGSHQITKAMASYFQALGGEIETGVNISDFSEIPGAKTVIFDTTPRQIIDIAYDELPERYIGTLRKFKYGCGVFKLDLALSDPIPWKDDHCRKAGTVHVGGTYEQISVSEKDADEGRHSARPFVLVAQHSLFDNTRAPEGKHTAWAYCHVPNGSERDMTEPVLNQIERFAPGFRDCIIGKHAMNTRDMQIYNPNYIGGDINGGKQDITQLFTRPAGLFDPYHIPHTNMFICSSSTPPGGGVHGMCGYHAAGSVLKRYFK